MSMNLDEYLASEDAGKDATSAEQDLASVIAKFNAEQPDETETVPNPPVKEEKAPDPEPVVTPAPKVDPEPEPQKPKEDDQNAVNAERRRQREAKIAQQALENSPEIRMMKELAEISGVSIEQMQANIRQAKIARELQAQGLTEEQITQSVPLVDRERQASAESQKKADATAQENLQLQFLQWEQNYQNSVKQVQAEHPYLTQVDIEAARDYMLNTLQNPDIPLADVVRTVHYQKIWDSKQAAMRTELLAEMSGRKETPLPPQGGAGASNAPTLSADEKFAAKMMGVSEADYMKYRDNPNYS